MDLGTLVFQFLVFPGILFAAVMGLLASWVDRFVTARVQMRVGPPVLQPLYDVLKLLIKETCIPEGAPRLFFLSAPLFGFCGVSLAAMLIGRVAGGASSGFTGDVIVVLYLLTLPAVSVVLGAMASRNPLASLGGSREMKLIMAYELPFVLAVLVPVIQAKGLRLETILAAPPAVATVPGILALLVAVLCMQAKLGWVPFDMSEAETELTGGALVEYSGAPLAIFKLTRAMMLFTLPTFLVVVFCGGIGGAGAGAIAGAWAKYVALVVVAVLIRNTAPRLRIDQAVKLFWGPVSVLALVAVVWAVMERT